MYPDIQSYVDLAVTVIEGYLLPDVCQIFGQERTPDEYGGYDEVLSDEPRQYNGGDDTPCRVDPTRQYRDQLIVGQEITVTDYNLNIPRDALIEVDDVVIHNGITYQVKKLTDDQSWSSVKIAYIVSVR